MINASTTGLCFETTEHLPVTQPLRIHLSLRAGRPQVVGKVVWCRLVGTRWDDQRSAVYKAGLEIEGGAVWRQELLSQIVASRPGRLH